MKLCRKTLSRITLRYVKFAWMTFNRVNLSIMPFAIMIYSRRECGVYFKSSALWHSNKCYFSEYQGIPKFRWLYKIHTKLSSIKD
jgi:hypothetical protein